MICILKAIHYFSLMYLRMFEMSYFLTATRLAWQAALKKAKQNYIFQLISIFLMVKNGIREGTGTISRYTKGNNKCKKDYDKIKKSLYLQYWDVNNLYG